MGIGVFSFIECMMTFDPEDISEAANVLKQSCETINRFRKNSGGIVGSVSRLFKNPDYDTYTDLEVHAQLVYSEIHLLKAILTLCDDKSLSSIIKAIPDLNTCYQSFRYNRIIIILIL